MNKKNKKETEHYEKPPTPEWKSPRRIEEEIRQYGHDVFERTMARVDTGEITREVALGMLAMAYEVQIDE